MKKVSIPLGGTGGGTVDEAQTNFSLVPGSDIQAFAAGLLSIAGLATEADRMIYTTALDVYAIATLSSFARTILDDADAGTVRATLESTTVGDALFTAASVAAAQQAIDTEVGVDVQAFDATIVVDADIGVSVQAYDATIVVDADIDVSVQAYDVDTAKLDVVQVWPAAQRGGITTLVDEATISIDLSANNNFIVTLAGNRVLANATSVVAGQSGLIYVVQDGGGGNTLSYEPNYKFVGGDAITLSTAGNANDTVYYYAVSSTEILLSSGLGWI